ncbi:MAG: hypothetical protein ACI865_001241 [Flavobacteriaceae bacterium]|jgi:hypothetical protein
MINLLFKLKMFITKLTTARPFIHGTKSCEQVQLNLLRQIIEHNAETKFGIDNQFSTIANYKDYSSKLPIREYEDFRPYILEQAKDENCKAIVNDKILFFNKTSGTTSEPKLIPVTETVMRGLKRSQALMIYYQYYNRKDAFRGRVVGIASPAEEEMSEFGIPIGAASGHFYKSVSKMVRKKYVIPYEVFEIEDYEVKYFAIALFCLMSKDISYIATANPTTILKIVEIINSNKNQILKDLATGKIDKLDNDTSEHAAYINSLIQIDAGRLKELEMLFNRGEKIGFIDLWPNIKLVGTWTGGSCGIALKALLTQMPQDVTSIDLGFVASEIRGTVVTNQSSQGGIPTYQDNFFEFVEKTNFEDGNRDYLLLHQLELGKEYYVIITTKAGLYRYHMNDIMKVVDFENKCPLLCFIQKGKGVCNITGEKLYEGQLLSALETLNLKTSFIQVVGDEQKVQYDMYAEFEEEEVNTTDLQSKLDELLCGQNNEYLEKRKSNRLKPIQISMLKKGTFEIVKRTAIEEGQREGQYKPVLLQLKNDKMVDLSKHVK